MYMKLNEKTLASTHCVCCNNNISFIFLPTGILCVNLLIVNNICGYSVCIVNLVNAIQKEENLILINVL